MSQCNLQNVDSFKIDLFLYLPGSYMPQCCLQNVDSLKLTCSVQRYIVSHTCTLQIGEGLLRHEPYQEGAVGCGDAAMRFDEGRLQFGHLLLGRGTDPIVTSDGLGST